MHILRGLARIGVAAIINNDPARMLTQYILRVKRNREADANLRIRRERIPDSHRRHRGTEYTETEGTGVAE